MMHLDGTAACECRLCTACVCASLHMRCSGTVWQGSGTRWRLGGDARLINGPNQMVPAGHAPKQASIPSRPSAGGRPAVAGLVLDSWQDVQQLWLTTRRKPPLPNLARRRAHWCCWIRASTCRTAPQTCRRWAVTSWWHQVGKAASGVCVQQLRALDRSGVGRQGAGCLWVATVFGAGNCNAFS